MMATVKTMRMADKGQVFVSWISGSLVRAVAGRAQAVEPIHPRQEGDQRYFVEHGGIRGIPRLAEEQVLEGPHGKAQTFSADPISAGGATGLESGMGPRAPAGLADGLGRGNALRRCD
jgi:hypothetical protein